MSKYNYSIDLSEELSDEMAKIDATISEYGKVSGAPKSPKKVFEKKPVEKINKPTQIKEKVKAKELVKDSGDIPKKKKAAPKKLVKKVVPKKKVVNAAPKKVKKAVTKKEVVVPEIKIEPKPEEAPIVSNDPPKIPGKERKGISFRTIMWFILILIIFQYGIKAYAAQGNDDLLQCSYDYVNSISDSPIILDGASEIESFWILKAFTSDDEELATNIFKMLACEDKLQQGLDPYKYDDCEETAFVIVTAADDVKGDIYDKLMGDGIEGYELQYVTEDPVSKVWAIAPVE